MKKFLLLAFLALLLPLPSYSQTPFGWADTLWTKNMYYNHANTECARFTPNDSILIVSKGNTLYQFDSYTGEIIDTFSVSDNESDYIPKFEISHDGNYIYFGHVRSGGYLFKLDIQSNSLIDSMSIYKLKHKSINDFVIHPNDSIIAVISLPDYGMQDSIITLINTNTMQPIRCTESKIADLGQVSIDISHDGELIAINTSGRQVYPNYMPSFVDIFSYDSLKFVKRLFTDKHSYINTVKFAGNTRNLIFAYYDSIFVYNTDLGQKLFSVKAIEGRFNVYNDSILCLPSGDWRHLNFWNYLTGDNFYNCDSTGIVYTVNTFNFSHNKELLFTGSNILVMLHNPLTMSIPEAIMAPRVEVYPNPVKDELTLPLYSISIKDIKICDETGKNFNSLIKSEDKYTGSQIRLNVSNLSAGVYFISYKSGNKYQTVKFIKEK